MTFDFSHFKQFEQEIKWQDISQGTQRFIDPQFKPQLSSLYDQNDTQLSEQKLEVWNKIEWHRPQEIFNGHEYRVFYHGIKPNDIEQGSLGNCYFLSAIAAIAEFPFRIAQIFQTDYANEAGCYAVRFCINGEFKDIVVDDSFPCFQNSTTPIFSSAKGYELWVLLIEKAWAKINRNYQSTIAGWCSQALRTLTGAPCYYLPNKDSSDLWEQIVSADQKKFIICASAGKEDMTDDEFNQMGLISNHAYSIISAMEVVTDDGPVRLLKLRNPWGHKEWSGDWSDSSDKWTPQLKELLDLQVVDDGQFWISLDDYVQYYNSTTICKMRENFEMQSLRLKHPKGKSCACLVTIKEKNTRIYFTASQYRWRMFARNSGYRASFLKMILCKLGDAFDYEKYQYIDARGTRAEDTTIQCEQGLDPGRYIIWIEAEWQFDQIDTIFFNTYNDKPVELQSYDLNPIEFLPQVLRSCALQKSKRKSYADRGDPDIFRCMSISDSKCQYGYVLYDNKSKKDLTLFQMLKFTKLDNYQLLETGEKPEQLHSRIRPGQSKIYVFKRTQRSASYSYTFYATMRKSDNELQSMIDGVLDQRKQVVFHGQPMQIYYTVFPHQVGYMWKFWNQTSDVTFEAEFEFEFQNMEFEDQEGSLIQIKLGPGETRMKSIVVKDLSQGYSYKNSFSYKCIDEE